MIRFLILIAIAGLVYWLWKWTMSRYERMKDQFQRRGFQSSETGKNTEVKTSELVQDPVCKLYIAKDSAIEYKGKYFCSEKCKNEYN